MTTKPVYEALGLRLSMLLNNVRSKLKPQEYEHVAEFIAANELGIALEALVGYLVEGGHPVTRADANIATQLAVDMKLKMSLLDKLQIREPNPPE